MREQIVRLHPTAYRADHWLIFVLEGILGTEVKHLGYLLVAVQSVPTGRPEIVCRVFCLRRQQVDARHYWARMGILSLTGHSDIKVQVRRRFPMHIGVNVAKLLIPLPQQSEKLSDLLMRAIIIGGDIISLLLGAEARALRGSR